MTPTADPAILEALGLDPGSARLSSHGGSAFSQTFRIEAKINGEDRLFFVKTGTGKDAEVMFAGEHTSLNVIYDAVPSFCPKSHAHGPLSNGPGHFLVTDFLDLSPGPSSAPNSGLSFAAKLAKLHMTLVPTPPGLESAQFGFPVPTCCGSTVQPNGYMNSWAEFFAINRLRAIMAASERSNGEDAELLSLVEKTADVVVPQLLRDGHLGGEKGIRPVVVHGDLWSGNHGRGSVDKGPIEEVVFDPSSCYGHSEFDLGIMKMFGGFGGKQMREYHDLKPKDEPVEEYEDRVVLYELYHHMNHHAMFGGGYRSGALAIMKKLIKKYDESK